MKIEHDVSNNRFVARIDGEDDEAELAYSMVAPRIIDLVHTYVPRSARGHGVAEALAQAALDFARDRGLKVVPTCPFVRRWLSRHPDAMKLGDAPYLESMEHRPQP